LVLGFNPRKSESWLININSSEDPPNIHVFSIEMELRKIENKIDSYLLLERKNVSLISSFDSSVATTIDLNGDDSFSVPSFSKKCVLRRNIALVSLAMQAVTMLRLC
jgi:hypothetical protein